jgi:hypothetical protein
MVVFEELESAPDKDWNLMSTKLKRWITSNEVIYSEKYIKSYESNNINNYIINTNVEAIKQNEGQPNTRKMFRFNPNNYYTTIDLNNAKKLRLKIKIIETAEYNFLGYGKGTTVTVCYLNCL